MPAEPASSIESIVRAIVREELERALLSLPAVAQPASPAVPRAAQPDLAASGSTPSSWFNITRAAEYAGVSRQTLGDALRAGLLVGSQQYRGAHWRVRRQDVDDWLLQGAPNFAPLRRKMPSSPRA